MSPRCGGFARKSRKADLQETVRQLQRSKPALLEASVVAELSTVVKIPGQSALSCFDPLTWPSCFVEFFYGDCVPNLPDRPNPNVTYQDLFSALVQREELQYNLETDTAPYRAKPRSRFDTPEFVACFADTVRRLKTMQMASAAFRRPGFEQDVKCISEAKTEDFLQAKIFFKLQKPPWLLLRVLYCAAMPCQRQCRQP